VLNREFTWLSSYSFSANTASWIFESKPELQPQVAFAGLLQKPTIREQPGKRAIRYWQEGGGYDRNWLSRAAITNAIDDLHENPRRRKLCSKLHTWRWSSYRYYVIEAQMLDEALPKIEPHLLAERG
jgi:hypothetical protein